MFDTISPPTGQPLPRSAVWEAAVQLTEVLRWLAKAPDECTPGQRVILAAALTEAAEDKTREAERCTRCLALPGLCFTCELMSTIAVQYRELARGLVS